jgi:hypothetical protein
MGGFYLIRYKVPEDNGYVEGIGALCFKRGFVSGVDSGGVRYDGTYTDNGRLLASILWKSLQAHDLRQESRSTNPRSSPLRLTYRGICMARSGLLFFKDARSRYTLKSCLNWPDGFELKVLSAANCIENIQGSTNPLPRLNQAAQTPQTLQNP